MTMNNVLVTGLNQFVVNDADFVLAGLGFKLDIGIPTNLTVTGDYLSDGLIGGLFSIRGKGPFRYELHYNV